MTSIGCSTVEDWRSGQGPRSIRNAAVASNRGQGQMVNLQSTWTYQRAKGALGRSYYLLRTVNRNQRKAASS